MSEMHDHGYVATWSFDVAVGEIRTRFVVDLHRDGCLSVFDMDRQPVRDAIHQELAKQKWREQFPVDRGYGSSRGPRDPQRMNCGDRHGEMFEYLVWPAERLACKRPHTLLHRPQVWYRIGNPFAQAPIAADVPTTKPDGSTGAPPQ